MKYVIGLMKREVLVKMEGVVDIEWDRVIGF